MQHQEVMPKSCLLVFPQYDKFQWARLSPNYWQWHHHWDCNQYLTGLSRIMSTIHCPQRWNSIQINNSLSTFTTQNAKRTFWNACSERRGVFSGFMDPRSVRILFLLPAKRIHSSTWSFSRSFQAVQEQNLQALTCTILLIKPGKKRIRLWPAERFLKALKKGSVFGLPSAF